MTLFPRRNRAATRKRGHYYERLAERYLLRHGLTLLARNFSSRFGEIDLILRDGDTIVFMEVRFRESDSHGGPLASIHFHKQQKIIKTAKLFLLTKGLYDKADCRFDALGISLKQGKTDYQWLKNAFQ